MSLFRIMAESLKSKHIWKRDYRGLLLMNRLGSMLVSRLPQAIAFDLEQCRTKASFYTGIRTETNLITLYIFRVTIKPKRHR